MRRPWLLAVVVMVVVVAVVVGVLVYSIRGTTRGNSSAPTAAASTSCDRATSSLVAPSSADANVRTNELFRVSSSPALDGPNTVVVGYESGDIIVDADLEGDRTPRHASLTESGRVAVRQCLAESGFGELDDGARYGTRTKDDGYICVADANTVTIRAELAAGQNKSVDAYALGPSMALAAGGGGCAQPFYPASLTFTYDALTALGERARKVGSPYETPTLRVVVDSLPTDPTDSWYAEAMKAPVIDIPPGTPFPEHPAARYPEDPAVTVSGDDARRWRDLLPADRRAAYTNRRVRGPDGKTYLAAWVPILPSDEHG